MANPIGTVTSVTIKSPNNTMLIGGKSIVTDGVYTVDINPTGVKAGTYTVGTATVSLDYTGRVTAIKSGSFSGVVSVDIKSKTLNVFGSPVVSSGAINIELPTQQHLVSNNMVGISISNPTITLNSAGIVESVTSGSHSPASVSSVGLASTSLDVSTSPVTTFGDLRVDLPVVFDGELEEKYPLATVSVDKHGIVTAISATELPPAPTYSLRASADTGLFFPQSLAVTSDGFVFGHTSTSRAPITEITSGSLSVVAPHFNPSDTDTSSTWDVDLPDQKVIPGIYGGFTVNKKGVITGVPSKTPDILCPVLAMSVLLPAGSGIIVDLLKSITETLPRSLTLVSGSLTYSGAYFFELYESLVRGVSPVFIEGRQAPFIVVVKCKTSSHDLFLSRSILTDKALSFPFSGEQRDLLVPSIVQEKITAPFSDKITSSSSAFVYKNIRPAGFDDGLIVVTGIILSPDSAPGCSVVYKGHIPVQGGADVLVEVIFTDQEPYRDGSFVKIAVEYEIYKDFYSYTHSFNAGGGSE